MRRFRTVAAALSACALLAACEDSTGSGGEAANEVRFSYSGDFDGSFDGSGDFPGISQRGEESFGVGVDLAPAFGDGVYGVLGSDQLGNGLADVFSITIDNLDEGTYNCTAAQVDSEDCPFFMTLAVDYDWDTGDDSGEFDLISGQLRIIEFSDDRIRGTFSATLAEIFDGAEIINVQGGTFDVDVRSFAQVIGSNAQRVPSASVFRN